MSTRAVPLTAPDTFRDRIQYQPWWYWGLAGGSGPVSLGPEGRQGKPQCRPILRQYGWQAGDAVSREQIARALVTAEDLVREHLEYSIAPAYREVTIPYPKLADRRMTRIWPVGSDGRWLSVELPEGEIRAIGVETHTTLTASVPIVAPFPYTAASPAPPYLIYRDLDGDSLVDTVEIGITDSDTPLDQIGAYVVPGDRFSAGEAISERWRIRPLTATRSGTTVVLTGSLVNSANLCVRPVLYQGAAAGALNGLDPAAAATFLDEVLVARRWTNPNGTTVETSQAVLIWESAPWPWCACPTSTTDPATTAQAIARVGIRDASFGMVTPAQAVYDADTDTWCAADCVTWWGCRPPDRVLIRYLAGLPLTAGGEVQAPWDVLICKLAAASLARPLAGCQDTNSLIADWQTDVTRAAGGTTFQAQPSANNPFGPKRGQIDAYQEVAERKLTRGVTG